jgi:MFS family permease
MTVSQTRRAWLTRNVLVLSGVSFLQDAASELLYPILPIFLTAVLGAPVAVVGLVEGAAEGAAAVTKLIAGRWGDRWPRRPLVGLGYGLAAVGKILIAAATAWPVVLAGRGVDRLGKGIRGAPRDALLVAGVAPAARGRVFGLHRAADTLGAVVGPLLGLAGYALLQHRIRPLLVIAVVPAVLSVLLVAAVRERAPARPGAAPARPAGASSRAGLPRAFWRVLTVLVFFSLVNFPDALLLLRLHEIGFGVAAVVATYVAYNSSYALLSYPAGALADRWPRSRIYAVGLACFAAAYLGLGLTESKPAAVLLLVVYGGFAASTDGVGKAWISTLAGDGQQAWAQGLFQGLTGGAILVAGVWAGLAWGPAGTLPLVVSGATATLLAAGLATGRLTPHRTG